MQMKSGEAIGSKRWRPMMTVRRHSKEKSCQDSSCCALGSERGSMNRVIADCSFGKFGSKEKKRGNGVPRMKQG